MNRWNKPPLPQRIREARLARGYKVSALAEALGVSKQAVSQYEMGIIMPKPDIMDRLAQKLDFPMSFFFKAPQDGLGTPVFFRSYATAEKMEREKFKVRTNWVSEILCYLNNYLDFTCPNINSLIKVEERLSSDEIEELACEVRRAWDIGLGPISDVTRLVENNGFIVVKIDTGVTKVDACSVIDVAAGTRPLIFLDGSKSSVRLRFDIAHEIGHILLHSWVDEEYLQENLKSIEDEAYQFASAFLMPSESFAMEYFSPSIESFIPLKRRWGVSIAAMIRRLFSLGLINEDRYKYFQRQINSRGYKKNEPLDEQMPQEEPQVLKRSIELLIDANIVKANELQEILSLPVSEIASLCQLDEQYFINLLDKPIPRLKRVK